MKNLCAYELNLVVTLLIVISSVKVPFSQVVHEAPINAHNRQVCRHRWRGSYQSHQQRPDRLLGRAQDYLQLRGLWWIFHLHRLVAARSIVSEQPIDGCTTLVGWLTWSRKHGPLMVVQPIIVCYTTLAGCTTRS